MSNLFVTKRLRVSPIQREDIPDYFEITRNPAIERYVPYACPSSLEESYEDYEKYYKNQDLEKDFYLIMRTLDTNEAVGGLIVNKNMENELDISMFMGSKFEHKGYMHETLLGFIDYMPDGTVLKFLVERDNTSSLNLVKHLKGTTEFPRLKGAMYRYRSFLLKVAH